MSRDILFTFPCNHFRLVQGVPKGNHFLTAQCTVHTMHRALHASLRATGPKTPKIFNDFVAQLYRVTKSQVWHGASCNFSADAQLLFRLQQRSILCNFVAKMRWTLIGQFLACALSLCNC